MTVFERARSFWRKEGEEGASKIPFSIFGPLSLLCTFAIAAKLPLDFLFLALSGLYLCARYQMKGFSYSLVLLLLGGGLKHLFLDSGHFWQLGLEGSLGIAFFITALSFEESVVFIQSMISQLDARSSSLKNLEEDLSLQREQATAQQIASQEKCATLQKELEELQSDHSSILILNEVLRKTAARHKEEIESHLEEAAGMRASYAILSSDLEGRKKELARLSNSEAMIEENRQLTKELNAARVQKEQTHLINETLARLHAKESLKAKEAAEQIHPIIEEKRKALEKLAVAEQTIEMLSKRLEQMAEERETARAALLQQANIQTERNFLQERLQAAEREIAHLKQKALDPLLLKEMDDLRAQAIQAKNLVQELRQETEKKQPLLEQIEKERSHFKEQLSYSQEKLQSLIQIEVLFKQLKKQFEEKNQILHETRCDLFKADTELQTLRMEKKELQSEPISKEFLKELSFLEDEAARLEEENQLLQDLVSHLQTEDAARRKKKVKTNSEDVPLLF